MYGSSNSSSNNSSPICSSLFNIPSPYCMQYEHELILQYYHDHLLPHPVQPLSSTAHDDALAADQSTETALDIIADSNKDAIISGNVVQQDEGCNKKKKSEISSKTRTPRNKRSSACKTDRHSKISTAQGTRDRRIRLSIDIARNFFKLQDTLGFDKASRTVDWLLNNSKSAIKELSKGCITIGMRANRAISSISESEVISRILDESPSDDRKKNKANAKGNRCNKEKKKMKKDKSARRAAIYPLAKETRKLARERARERTKLKKNIFESHDLNNTSWNSNFFGRGGESGKNGHTNMNIHPSQEMQVDIDELKKQLVGTQEGTANDCNFVNTGSWNPFAIFNYQQNDGVCHEHQFTDFPCS